MYGDQHVHRRRQFDQLAAVGEDRQCMTKHSAYRGGAERDDQRWNDRSEFVFEPGIAGVDLGVRWFFVQSTLAAGSFLKCLTALVT